MCKPNFLFQFYCKQIFSYYQGDAIQANMDVSEKKNSSQPTLSLEKPIESQASRVFLQPSGSKLWRTRHLFHLPDSQSLMLYHR